MHKKIQQELNPVGSFILKKHNTMIKNYILSSIILMFMASSTIASAIDVVNPNDFQYSMTLTGKLFINGAESTDANDIVYAYVNGELRGSAQVMHFTSVDIYIVLLTIYSNNLAGETVDFKIMDDSSASLVSCSTQVTFESDSNMGTPSNPYEISGSVATGLAKTDLNQPEGIKIYPNPTNGIVNLSLEKNNVQQITIFDTAGNAIINETAQFQNKTIDLSQYQSGVYFISIQTTDGVVTSKIRKE